MDSLVTTPRTTVILVTTETPGDRLRRLREQRKLGVREVARLSEGAFSHSYVSNLESGVSSWSSASLQIIQGFARAFRMDVHELIREVGGRAEVIPEPPTGTRTLPVYSWVSGGAGLEGGEVVDQLEVPDTWTGEFQAYRIEGDSMSPRIPDNSTIVVKRTANVRPGQMIVAWVPEVGMLIKHFERITADGTYVLSSFNPAYDPIFTRDMHVYGFVFEVRTQYPNGAGQLVS